MRGEAVQAMLSARGSGDFTVEAIHMSVGLGPVIEEVGSWAISGKYFVTSPRGAAPD
jgi:hypothetical protein